MSLLKTETAMVELRVRLESFEGPLDLLLHLVKKEEVDIYDIPIEKITTQYLEYLKAMQELDLEIAGEFLVVAATLVYIKSRTLLPKEQQPPEDDAEDDDPRWDLIRQLVEYKKFKDAAFQLQQRQLNQEKVFERGGTIAIEDIPTLPEEGVGDIQVFDLIQAFQKVLARLEQKPVAPKMREIEPERFTVSDKMQFIEELTSRQERVKFEDFFSDAASRAEIVVTFLAMLEMIRLRRLRVIQNEALGEIEITRADTTSEHSEALAVPV